ncbi:hypothetical protein [Nisaea denitrificans]|uniref:hypothetical protein n=1 Tax=Nisaea denitrificans TaxID=390877 RepID=UPI0012EBC383|nr:hypothetical protein [Nisaea denitrificans]
MKLIFECYLLLRSKVRRIFALSLIAICASFPSFADSDTFFGQNIKDLAIELNEIDKEKSFNIIRENIFSSSFSNKTISRANNIRLKDEENIIEFQILMHPIVSSHKYQKIEKYMNQINYIIKPKLNNAYSINDYSDTRKDKDINFYFISNDNIKKSIKHMNKKGIRMVIYDWNLDYSCVSVNLITNKRRIYRIMNFISNNIDDIRFDDCAKNSAFKSIYFGSMEGMVWNTLKSGDISWSGDVLIYDIIGAHMVYKNHQSIEYLLLNKNNFMKIMNESILEISNCVNSTFKGCKND